MHSLVRVNSLIVVAAGLASAAASSGAEPSSARDVLRARGLRKVGFYFILGGERELADALEGLGPLEHKVEQAVDFQKKYDALVRSAKNELVATNRQRNALLPRLMQAGSDEEVAAVGLRILALTDRISVLEHQLDNDREAQEIREAVAAVREEYTQKVLDIHELIRRTQAEYETLAGDEEVTAALEEYGRQKGRTFKLGPRGVFLANIRKFKEFEASLQLETVKLRNERGVYWLDVVLNGTVTKSMIFDTGASYILLPAQFAKDAGIHVSDKDPVIMIRVADGREVAAQRVMVDSVRVGGFEVQAVECVVTPPELKDAPPLLGQSFISQFTYRMDAQARTLTLSAIKN